MRIDLGVIALDQPALLERPHPPQAGRSRNPSPLGQFDIGHAAVALQVVENPAVDPVEFDPLHKNVTPVTGRAQ